MHGDNNSCRLAGRVIRKNIDSHILIGLILIGCFFTSTLISSVLVFFSAWAWLGVVISLLILKSLFLYIKKNSDLKRKLEGSMYDSSDKSYVWNLEDTRDKLMARVLQENICPWSTDNQCVDKNNCMCERQRQLLKMSDVYREQKVTLSCEQERT